MRFLFLRRASFSCCTSSSGIWHLKAGKTEVKRALKHCSSGIWHLKAGKTEVKRALKHCSYELRHQHAGTIPLLVLN